LAGVLAAGCPLGVASTPATKELFGGTASRQRVLFRQLLRLAWDLLPRIFYALTVVFSPRVAKKRLSEEEKYR